MKLSILTPGIPTRGAEIAALSEKIAKQIEDAGAQGQVEHLVLIDNRMRPVGAKRQALIDIARGDYVAFVDDDDDIADGYVAKIIEAAGSGADVITFLQDGFWNGQHSEVHFRLSYQDRPFAPGQITQRGPWHVCAWRRDRVAGCQFGESNSGEDIIWSRQARRRVKTETHIPEVLHIYRHDERKTAAPMLSW